MRSQCRRANPIFPKFTRLEPGNAGFAGRDQPSFSRTSGARTQKSDLPFRYCTEQLQIFAENDAELLFVHIREPEEIERFRQTAGVNCKTILVRRPTLEQARGQLGNRSDDGVAAYAYDAEFLNDGSLEELPAKVHDFLQALIER